MAKMPMYEEGLGTPTSLEPYLTPCMPSCEHPTLSFRCYDCHNEGRETEATHIYVDACRAEYACDNHAAKYHVLLKLEGKYG